MQNKVWVLQEQQMLVSDCEINKKIQSNVCVFVCLGFEADINGETQRHSDVSLIVRK